MHHVRGMTTDIAKLEAALADAQAKSHAAMDRRRALPPGSSRARVTTANANWARAAEHRDRVSDMLDAARAAAQPAAPAPAPAPAPEAPAALTYRPGATITLGRSTYTITRVSSLGLELRGESSLVQCAKQPTLWSHVSMSGMRARSVDYWQNPDGTFRIG